MWMLYYLSFAGARRSSTNLEDLGLPKPPPSMLGGEVKNLFCPSVPTSLADRRALWLLEQVTCPLQQPRLTLAGTHDQL